METLELGNLSLNELKRVITDAEQTIETRKKTELKNVRRQVKDIIKDNGYSPSDIFPALKGAQKPKGKVAPKYRNPEDADQTWTGRGRKPLWIKSLDESGALESAAI
ncbi:MAG: H-NS histone family protein [Thiotrichaceae bacterium]|nr:H-NS histone family protein [Thiotrichaceae bacterium]